MQLLTDRDQALYSGLVRLAKGNSELVMDVLSQPDRRSMTLTHVMHEIDERMKEQAQAPKADAGVIAGR